MADKPRGSLSSSRKSKSKLVRPRRAKSLQPVRHKPFAHSGERHLSDKFILQKEIGRGGYSRVYSAKRVIKAAAGPNQDSEHDELVAVKVVSMPRKHKQDTTDKDTSNKYARKQSEIKVAMEILDNEVSVMRRIVDELPQHRDRFVQLLDVVYEENRRLCIVMELLDGQDMFDRIVAKTHYSERDACNLFESIVTTVKALHSIGVIHRDLKPENFVFASPEDNSHLKLTDFGLAWDMAKDDPNAKVKLVGSPGYVAPEVLTRGQYSPAGDVWSMGVILFVLLSGYPPFRAKSIDEQMSRIVHGDYNFNGRNWDNVSKLGQHLVSRMLTVDVERRITVDEVLQHPWFLEAKLKSFGEDLQSTIQELRGLNDRRKITEAAMTVLSQAESNIREGIWNLIENSPYSNGFSQQDYVLLKQAVLEMKNEGTVSHERFVQVLSSLGFGELPLDEVFVLFDEDGDGVVDVDELVVGIPTVLLMESRENLLKFLFEIYDNSGQARPPALQAAMDQAHLYTRSLTPVASECSWNSVPTAGTSEHAVTRRPSLQLRSSRRSRKPRLSNRSEFSQSAGGMQQPPTNPVSGITMNSLAAILRTLAGYERYSSDGNPVRTSSQGPAFGHESLASRRAALAAKLSELGQALVSSTPFGQQRTPGENQQQLLTFEQFKQNVNNFGDDFVQEYLFGPLEEITEQLSHSRWFKLDTLVANIRQMAHYSRRTMQRWQQRYVDGSGSISRSAHQRQQTGEEHVQVDRSSSTDSSDDVMEYMDWGLPDFSNMQQRMPLNDSFQSLYTFRINTL